MFSNLYQLHIGLIISCNAYIKTNPYAFTKSEEISKNEGFKEG